MGRALTLSNILCNAFDEDYTVDHAGWVIAYAPDDLNHSIYPFGIRQSQWTNDLQVLAAMG